MLTITPTATGATTTPPRSRLTNDPAAAFAALSTVEQLARIEDLARQALPLYGLPSTSKITLLNYSENATWLIRPPGGPRRVLRINRPGYHPRVNIASELEWVSAIKRDTPIVTAEPLPALDGEYIQHIWHPGVPEPRNCVLMTFVEGTEPDDTNRLATFELLGEVTARLHAHVVSWKPSRPMRRFRWDFETILGPHAPWGHWQNGLDMTPAIRRHLQRVIPVLRKHSDRVGTGKTRFGLIHADLRAANLLVNNGTVAAIDFDDCGYSWFIYDLAAALSFIETHPELPAMIESWLRGYAKVRKLSPVELDEIDTFIMMRRLQLVAWIGTHSDTAQAQTATPGFTEATCTLAERYLSAKT
ncbi:aminoglycoside phosphotransferase [Opitutaceae bacterium TAV4]|nr:aminoglycoside phosphotransferase [Opitutaceae bacterium TAV4]RRK00671.1 aminoglycoside phosphotransferase [Opitutaceae bacterium TAV3]